MFADQDGVDDDDESRLDDVRDGGTDVTVPARIKQEVHAEEDPDGSLGSYLLRITLPQPH